MMINQAAITIAEIAERADVGFGSFYNHFPSKEAILEATTEREAHALRLAIDQVALVLQVLGVAAADLASLLTRPLPPPLLLITDRPGAQPDPKPSLAPQRSRSRSRTHPDASA